jgi:hypothetical protein
MASKDLVLGLYDECAVEVKGLAGKVKDSSSVIMTRAKS